MLKQTYNFMRSVKLVKIIVVRPTVKVLWNHSTKLITVTFLKQTLMAQVLLHKLEYTVHKYWLSCVC